MSSDFNVNNVRVTPLEKTRVARESFLQMDYSKKFTLPSNYKSKYFIYIIMNLETKKAYVGKCKDIYGRANNYIWNCNNPDYRDNRPIIKALRSNGLDKFVMFPIETCDNKSIAEFRENYYIKALNTTDRTIGYNVETAIDNRKSLSGSNGYHHTIDTKNKKSKSVICINPDTKLIFIAVGMKIFADYMQTSKDLIKNCARRPCMYKGYYIIYLNDTDREEILNKAIMREEAQVNRNRKYYETYGEAPLSKLPMYIDMVKFVDRFLENPSTEFFVKEGYDAHVLKYETDPSTGCTYKLETIDNFINIRD